MSRLGPRSQRKASSLAKAAISKQSDEPTKLWAGGSSGSGIGDVVNRPLSIKERQQLDQDSEEKIERERKTRLRKVRRRLDELERTNPRDAISSSRVGGGESSSRNDGESLAVPNTALEAAARRRQERLKSGQKGSNVMADPSSGPLSTARKQSAAVRRLLTYRRPFYALLEDAASDPTFNNAASNYLTASADVATVAARYRKLASPDSQGDSDPLPSVLAGLAYPAKPPFCTVCSEAGSVDCPRCGDRTCERARCLETHNDTRCDRPVR